MTKTEVLLIARVINRNRERTVPELTKDLALTLKDNNPSFDMSAFILMSGTQSKVENA